MPVVVVGAGIAGCTVALAIRSRGSEVVLVDRPDLDGAATPASAGMVAPMYESDPAEPTFALGLESRTRYPDFLARVNELASSDVGLEEGGMLVANLSEAEDRIAARKVAALREQGLAADILSGSEARRIEPVLAPHVESSVWFPEAARVNCRRLSTALREAILAAGVRLTAGRAAAVRITDGRARGVTLDDGRSVPGSAVVIAAGCWSPEVGSGRRSLPVRPVRGQILRLAAEELPSGPVLADHEGRYLVPRPGGALAGSTMEEAGFVAEVTDAGLDAIRGAVGRLCPAAAVAPAIASWAGLRPVSEDGRPVVGPDPGLEGLNYATGFGRSGILLAPLLAETVADLTLGARPDLDWEAFAITRFSRPETADSRTSA